MKPGRIKVLVNPKACQGCRACESVCSLSHHGVISPNGSGIQIREKEVLGTFVQLVCQQCIDMPCASACPKSIITRSRYSGAVEIGEGCIGCEKCREACPINAIQFMNQSAVKCDLCGGLPKCVETCPRQVLSW
jgi:Fe-S-cluster-containing hydrogenase component 2